MRCSQSRLSPTPRLSGRAVPVAGGVHIIFLAAFHFLLVALNVPPAA
jgi:hypothetical protein